MDTVPIVALPNLSWASIQTKISPPSLNTKPLVETILSRYHVDQTSPFRVLNMNCASGEYLLEFAKNKCDTFGVDSDFQNLELIVTKQVNLGLTTRLFHVQDPHIYDLKNINLIVFFEQAFCRQYENKFQTKASLSSLSKTLSNSGIVLIELTNNNFQSFSDEIQLDNETSAQINMEFYQNNPHDMQSFEEVTTLRIDNEGDSITTSRRRKLRLWTDEEIIGVLKELSYINIQKINILDRFFIIGINTL